MSYKLTNISGGQIVCNLASGETLRLDNKGTQTIKNTDMTEHLLNLEKLGYMKCDRDKRRGRSE